GYDRALVLVHDVPTATLRGFFGLNVRDDQARAVSISLTRSQHPVVTALRSDIPQRCEDVLSDERLAPAERAQLLAMRIPHFVAASLATTGPQRASAVVLLGRDHAIEDTDLARLLPFTRQAGAALTREHNVGMLRRASESHAIEKEWLWWMLNSVADPVLVADAENDIIQLNRRAELLFRASDEDSPGKRRAVWMNNFLFTAARSTW